ncbi:MAG: PKD domain-containing protein, partial [Propionibacteriaceae bacterium]|nr:PKD domain-containing protein [Propionibacteriaceae bacterium]
LTYMPVPYAANAALDPDGTIDSYAWDFGDGNTGTGRTPNHDYAAANTYTVTLTVTDNDGATDSVSHDVTTTAPPTTLAEDAFGRTVASGWGDADTGGSWTVSSPSYMAVGSGVGTMRMNAGSGRSAYLNSVSGRDVELSTTVSYEKVATGGGTYTSFIARRNGSSDYRLKLRINPNGTYVYLSRVVNGSETVLTSQTITGMNYAADEVLKVRFQVEGSGTTTLRAKVWKQGAAEPGSWQATATDSTASLQSAGAVGIYSYLSGSATNPPITASFDEFLVDPLG